MYFFSTSIFMHFHYPFVNSSECKHVSVHVSIEKPKTGPEAEYITWKMGPNQVINGIVTP